MITPEQLAASGTEDGHQAAVFCWAGANLDRYPQLKWMYAIPNGGYRNPIEAQKLKATGTRSGVPDIFLPTAKNGTYVYHGLYIEMKHEKYRNRKLGGCSESQINFIDYLTSADYYVVICYHWIGAVEMIKKYLDGEL